MTTVVGIREEKRFLFLLSGRSWDRRRGHFHDLRSERQVIGVRKGEAIKKQARRPEQACALDDRHGAGAVQLKVNGEFTGRVLDREGLGVSGADLRDALGDRTRDHAGCGHGNGPEDNRWRCDRSAE
jgi:hypothetical protein